MGHPIQYRHNAGEAYMSTGESLIIPQPLYERASRVAYYQQRDVADLVADVLAQSLPVIEEQIDHPEQKQEREAFVRLHPMLQRKYLGEYVAIHGGELVDHDADRLALLKRIDRNYPDLFVLIRPVREEPEIVYEYRSVRWGS
jgi:hypothetical protein